MQAGVVTGVEYAFILLMQVSTFFSVIFYHARIIVFVNNCVIPFAHIYRSGIHCFINIMVNIYK